MKKKQIVHYAFNRFTKILTACGADIQSNFSGKLKTTNRRDRVTCKRCKATRRFRKVR